MHIGPEKRLRILSVSSELLRHALHLPEGTRFLAATADLHFDRDQISFKIEHPEFTPVLEGRAVPEVRPLLGEKRVPTFLGWEE